MGLIIEIKDSIFSLLSIGTSCTYIDHNSVFFVLVKILKTLV